MEMWCWETQRGLGAGQEPGEVGGGSPGRLVQTAGPRCEADPEQIPLAT